MSCVEL